MTRCRAATRSATSWTMRSGTWPSSGSVGPSQADRNGDDILDSLTAKQRLPSQEGADRLGMGAAWGCRSTSFKPGGWPLRPTRSGATPRSYPSREGLDGVDDGLEADGVEEVERVQGVGKFGVHHGL